MLVGPPTNKFQKNNSKFSIFIFYLCSDKQNWSEPGATQTETDINRRKRIQMDINGQKPTDRDRNRQKQAEIDRKNIETD